jgi:hypothetical protein
MSGSSLGEILSEEEKEELRKNPPALDFQPATEEQFLFRLSIAKKMCAFFNQVDASMTAEYRAIYEKYPMWAFYESTDPEATLPRRVYGAMVRVEDDGSIAEAVHAATAHIAWVNYVLGGVLVTQLKRVDRWSENSTMMINMSGAKGMFCDPLGFIIAVEANQP